MGLYSAYKRDLFTSFQSNYPKMRLIINNGIVINPSVLHVNAKGNLKISCPVAEDGKCCSLITQHTGLMLLMLKYCKKDTIVDCSGN